MRLGSRNAALVVENSYWLWFERCSFLSMSIGSPCINGTVSRRNPYCGYGQRPSVILRGQNEGGIENSVVGASADSKWGKKHELDALVETAK